MKTIIAGSRNYTDYDVVKEELDKHQFTKILSGGATGVDSLGERYAKENGIPLSIYPAKWNIHGKAAGPIRNSEMANRAEKLIAFYKENSKGTFDMINKAKSKGLEVITIKIN